MDMDTIKNTIPHGSGINYDWIIADHISEWILSNRYDTMTEYGRYDRVVPFKLHIPKNSPMNFRLTFASGSHYWVMKYGLREYLDDLFTDWIRKLRDRSNR